MGMKIRQNSHRRSKASKKNQPIPGPQITTPPPQKKIYIFPCMLFAELWTRDLRALPRISNCFKSSQPKNTSFLTLYGLAKKTRNRKFQTQKYPSIIPVTWNPEYLLLVFYCVQIRWAGMSTVFWTPGVLLHYAWLRTSAAIRSEGSGEEIAINFYIVLAGNLVLPGELQERISEGKWH